MTGFNLQTTDFNGNLIDTATNQSSISLVATNPVRGSSQSANVDAYPLNINAISNLTLFVQNMNPLLTGATV